MKTSEHRELGGDAVEMARLDRYVSMPEKQDICREFVLNMSDEHFEKFQVLPAERRAYLLRLYAEKHYNTNLGIVPYTS